MVLGALPTRWNSADHPTRNSRIPAPFPCQIASLDDPLQVHALARLRGLRRWAANCARLAILLAPGILDYVISPADFRKYSSLLPGYHPWISIPPGFPGEGPLTPRNLRLYVGLLTLGFSLSMATLTFQNSRPPNGNPNFSSVRRDHGEATRRAARSGIVLDEGRRVLLLHLSIETFCFKLLKTMNEQGIFLSDILFSSPLDIDALNERLVAYGEAYYHYCETNNALTCKRPIA